jgi:hypothetical protein
MINQNLKAKGLQLSNWVIQEYQMSENLLKSCKMKKIKIFNE